MTAIMSSATQQMLRRFVDGSCPPDEFESWLIATSDDDDAPASERAAVNQLRLMMLECGEARARGMNSPPKYELF